MSSATSTVTETINANTIHTDRMKLCVWSLNARENSLCSLLEYTRVISEILNLNEDTLAEAIEADKLRYSLIMAHGQHPVGFELTSHKHEILKACIDYLRKGGESKRVKDLLKTFESAISEVIDGFLFDTEDDVLLHMNTVDDDGEPSEFINEECLRQFCKIQQSEIKVYRHTVEAVLLLRSKIETQIQNKKKQAN